jgi:signal peptidase I
MEDIMAIDNESIGGFPKQDGGFAKEMFEWTEAIVTALVVVMILMLFLFRPASVEGSSMVPTLADGDRLVFTDIDYTPKQGDIVIVDSEGLGKFIVKRVIATAGQTIDIDFVMGTVTVDGVLLDEPYINAPTMLDEGGHTYPAVVPADSVFVMGDNRMHSTDSRSDKVGFVNNQDIFGKVLIRVFPFDDIGFVK